MRLKKPRRARRLVGAAIAAVLCWIGLGVQPTPDPKSGTVKVIGMVAKEGEYPWRKGITVRQLIADAGGLTPFGGLKVEVHDRNPAWYVKLGRRAKGWFVASVNWTSEGLDAAWDTCHLPGHAPDFSMRTVSRSAKATIHLRKSAEDIQLFPGDVVLVPEKIITF